MASTCSWNKPHKMKAGRLLGRIDELTMPLK